jgi:putative DNA-invertase from lambdoid prophage Rac
MRIAIYCRVSREDLNLDNQKLGLIEEAKRRGWEYEVFEETESTRKTRPIKEKLLKLLREGKFDGVIVYKVDRWARSLQELIMNIEELKNRGKHFIVLTQPIDTSNASGMLMLQLIGAFAEFEREMIRERTMAGLDRARAKGIKLGRPRKAIKKHGRIYALQEVS